MAGGAPLTSQSTISRLENTPCKTEAARLTAALIDQAAATIRLRKQEILDIDDTFCAAHGARRFQFVKGWASRPVLSFSTFMISAAS
jgi:hypothetical protein